MPFPPRSTFDIQTVLDPEEAGGRLSAAIDNPGRLNNLRFFVGSLAGSSFDVMRATRGRNSLRPRIRGTIESTPGGSRIHGTMQLHTVVLVALCVIGAMPTWLAFTMARYSWKAGQWDPSILAIPAAGVVVLVVFRLAFVLERRRALRELMRLVEGRPAPTDS